MFNNSNMGETLDKLLTPSDFDSFLQLLEDHEYSQINKYSSIYSSSERLNFDKWIFSTI